MCICNYDIVVLSIRLWQDIFTAFTSGQEYCLKEEFEWLPQSDVYEESIERKIITKKQMQCIFEVFGKLE